MDIDDVEIICTCGEVDPWDDHDRDCDLWRSSSWRYGDTGWDEKTQALQSVDVLECEGCHDSLRDCMCLSRFDWAGVEVLEDEIEEEVIEMKKVDKENYTTWSTEDYIALEEVGFDLHDGQHTGPEGQRYSFYNCWCTTPQKSYCDKCGVVKHGDRWSPNLDRREMEVALWLQGWTYECFCVGPIKKGATCSDCGVQRSWEKKTAGWGPWTYYRAPGTSSYSSFSGAAYTPKCRHYGHPVKLPDGTVVQVSSMMYGGDKKEREGKTPDLGIYLDSGWRTNRLAWYINWPDGQEPAIPYSDVRYAAEQMLAMAKGGFTVETGCIGGHGRTGSFLAVLLMVNDGLTAEEAVWWVWKNYCDEAIETDTQLWYLRTFEQYLKGLPLEEKPKPPPAKTYSWKSGGDGFAGDGFAAIHQVREHEPLFLAGKHCGTDTNEMPCPYWNQDVAEFNKKGLVFASKVKA